ncbi:hypothetical protein CK203_100619 [Vitis vinifera]|uniref:Retrotransposon gag domain-containing protein n=1 Tax=Vitis vinifera TaxID=29760 RepID=A0A438FIK9_VITVI|nr:hypothetical protein CK203_100619 [Vitis vinifera]
MQREATRAHTPMPELSVRKARTLLIFSAKRQRDKRSQLSNSMRARLGPQEPGRPRPPVATTGATRPNPMINPVVQNVLPYRDPWSPSWCGTFTHTQRDLSEAFVGQYLCSARHKQNISTLQNIKMQDNESLREFVKRFGQAVLQVEACSMDAVLQIFKRSICPGTPFFESLAKKPPTTMDTCSDVPTNIQCSKMTCVQPPSKFWLPDDASRGDTERNAKPPDRPRPSDRRHEGPSRPDRPPLTPLSISYEKLLPMIQGLSDFRSLQYLVERLIKAGHLKQYSAQMLEEKSLPNITTLEPLGPNAPKAVINYINGGPSDEEYDSRRKRQKLLRAASIRERINSIRPGLTGGGPRPIDGTIIFPPVDPTRTLQPHRDALILSLEIGDFDVRRILVDLGSSADLVQASVVSRMGHSLTGLENPGRILSGFNGSSTTSLGDIILLVQAGPVTLNVQFSVCSRVVTLQCHLRAHMATLHESHPFYISSNGEFPHQRGTN